MAPPPRRAEADGHCDFGPFAGRAGRAEVALVAQLAHGEELDDPVLHVAQAVMVGVEHRPGRGQVEVVRRGLAPGQVEHAVEPGADPALLGALRAGALQAVDLLVDRLPHLGRNRQRLQPGAVLGGRIAVVLAQLLADGGQLLAQQVLPLLLLDALGDVGADLLVDLQLGQVLLGPGQHQLHPSADLGGLEHGEAVVVRRLGPGGHGVGERPGIAGRPQDLRQPARTAQRRRCPPARPAAPGPARPRGGWSGRPASGSTSCQRPLRSLTTSRRAGHLAAPPAGWRPRCRSGAGRPARRRRCTPTRRAAPVERGHDDDPPVVGAGRGDGGAGVVGVEREGGDGAGEQHGIGQGDDRERDGLGAGAGGVGVSHGRRLTAATCDYNITLSRPQRRFATTRPISLRRQRAPGRRPT